MTGHLVVRSYTIDANGSVLDSVDYASVSGIKVRLVSDTATVSTADSAITVNGAFTFTRWTPGRHLAIGCVRGFPIDSSGPIVLGSSSANFPAPLVLGTYGPIHAYPNPTNGADRIQFALDSARTGRVLVTTMEGEVVRTLVSQELPAGAFVATWDGLSDSSVAVPAGTYWAVLDWRSRQVPVAPGRSPARALDVIPVPVTVATPPVSCTVIVKQ